MSTQKALLLVEKFGALVVGNAAIPKPGPGEVLIRVQAAGLNPVDWKVRKFGIYIQDFPAILGVDIAGDVEEVGPDVTNVRKGDRVFTHGGFKSDHDAFQQYTKADASLLSQIPTGTSYDEAATLPTALATAFLGLYSTTHLGFDATSVVNPEARGKYNGTPLIVNGGSSSVGKIVIQLAKASGFNPLITTASAKHAENLKSLGATHVIDRHAPVSSFVEEVRKITQSPIAHAYDAVGGNEIQSAIFELLGANGRFVYTAGLNPQLEGRDNYSRVLSLRTVPDNIPSLKTLWTNIASLISEGIIKPSKVEVLPGGLAGIPDGLQRLENNEVSGVKLIAHPQENI
ncbi:GroES-like protein [Coprinopsis marcescibilis]|uniref:GroES-like protein n=1 Tax=Coprinopsis marcescibilis TaxID=230819 RepID=A0A5C3KSP5_COPMA|nr:GroES-like protein [Coprinopsis marcescibilis]